MPKKRFQTFKIGTGLLDDAALVCLAEAMTSDRVDGPAVR